MARDDLIVDVMPVDESILGFKQPGVPAAIETRSDDQHRWARVRVVTPALFIETKLAAFHGEERVSLRQPRP